MYLMRCKTVNKHTIKQSETHTNTYTLNMHTEKWKMKEQQKSGEKKKENLSDEIV